MKTLIMMLVRNIKEKKRKESEKSMLITGKEMLKIAKEKKFAVPAFNAGSGQLLPAIMDACKEEKAPFIIGYSS